MDQCTVSQFNNQFEHYFSQIVKCLLGNWTKTTAIKVDLQFGDHSLSPDLNPNRNWRWRAICHREQPVYQLSVYIIHANKMAAHLWCVWTSCLSLDFGIKGEEPHNTLKCLGSARANQAQTAISVANWTSPNAEYVICYLYVLIILTYMEYITKYRYYGKNMFDLIVWIMCYL